MKELFARKIVQIRAQHVCFKRARFQLLQRWQARPGIIRTGLLKEITCNLRGLSYRWNLGGHNIQW